mgnify:CR=1 FL=1
MKTSKPYVVAGSLVLAGILAPVHAAADMASGEVLANTCYSCHGPDGNSAGAMPTISGKSEQFITGQLRSFKAAGQEITVMGRIAKGFSDDEINALAKFFASK